MSLSPLSLSIITDIYLFTLSLILDLYCCCIFLVLLSHHSLHHICFVFQFLLYLFFCVCISSSFPPFSLSHMSLLSPIPQIPPSYSLLHSPSSLSISCTYVICTVCEPLFLLFPCDPPTFLLWLFSLPILHLLCFTFPSSRLPVLFPRWPDAVLFHLINYHSHFLSQSSPSPSSSFPTSFSFFPSSLLFSSLPLYSAPMLHVSCAAI